MWDFAEGSVEHYRPVDMDARMEAVTGKRIRVMCPQCHKVGVIVAEKDVLVDGMLGRADSMVKVQVFPGDVCEHEFQFTLDVNFKAR